MFELKKQSFVILLPRANGEIERLRRIQASEMEGTQTQLRYAQLRVQSLEQELKSVKQELEQKVHLFILMLQFIVSSLETRE